MKNRFIEQFSVVVSIIFAMILMVGGISQAGVGVINPDLTATFLSGSMEIDNSDMGTALSLKEWPDEIFVTHMAKTIALSYTQPPGGDITALAGSDMIIANDKISPDDAIISVAIIKEIPAQTYDVGTVISPQRNFPLMT